MYVELFVISGKSQELEESLKKAIEDIRSKVERRDRVRLATVKIRQDAAEQVVKMMDMPVERVPPHFRSLVSILKRYNVSAFPAVVIDGQKVLEGSDDVAKALEAVYRKANEEFGIALGPAQQPAATQPIQPSAPPQQPTSPAPQLPPPVQPPPIAQSEVKPLTEVSKPPEAPRPIQQPPPLTPPPAPKPPPLQPIAVQPAPRPPAKVSVRIVVGRPDDCRECAYFGETTSRCYLFGLSVADPARPPCKNVGG